MNEIVQQQGIDFMLAEAIRRHAASEAIQAVVDKQIGEIIQDAVKEELRTWGDIGKQLKVKVKEALELPDLDLPSYGHMVAARFRAVAEQKIDGLIKETIEQEINELFNLAPPVIRMEDVLEALRVNCREWEKSDRFYFEADLRDGTDTFWITIHPDAAEMTGSHRKTKHDAHFHMLVSPADLRDKDAPPVDYYKDHFKISALWVEGSDASKTQRFGMMDKWERMIWQAYVCKTPIILGDLDPSLDVDEY